jgi:hypothetical protein
MRDEIMTKATDAASTKNLSALISKISEGGKPRALRWSRADFLLLNVTYEDGAWNSFDALQIAGVNTRILEDRKAVSAALAEAFGVRVRS